MTEEYTPKWGMIIDQDRCTGCNACVTACSMENNIPWTGEEETGYGRGMHWVRVQRYWHGEYPGIQPEYIPSLCQQCGHAPCEPVCPVFATVHSESEQINLQIYNRCIGTRYCANNCPYTARQFNWFDHEFPTPMDFYLNPDVTVRRRGVMEKCTFCVQRIRRGQDQARSEARQVKENEIIPACVQTCPSGAMVFGDLNNPNSMVSRLARSKRGYQLLPELGDDTKIIYLKGGGLYGG